METDPGFSMERYGDRLNAIQEAMKRQLDDMVETGELSRHEREEIEYFWLQRSNDVSGD